MHVVMVTESLASGVLQVIRDISNYIVSIKESIQVTIVYSRRAETPAYNSLRSMFSTSINLIEIQACRELSFSKDLQTLRDYISVLNNIEPDVLHLHSSKAGALGRIARIFLKKRPIIYYSPHGFSFLRKDLSIHKRFIFKSIESVLSLFPGKIIAVSESERKYARFFRNKVILINNGVDIEQFNYNEKKMMVNLDKPVTLGTIGRLSFQKNPFFVVEFVKELKMKLEMPIRFIWIGEGELSKEIKSLIDREKLNENFIITGWITREKVLDMLINEIEYYVQFSLWEGLSISLLECMAMGKAPIVTDIPGNIDAVLHNNCGQIINSVEEAVDAAVKYVKNQQIYQEHSLNAALRVRNNFSLNKMLEGYCELYLQVE